MKIKVFHIIIYLTIFLFFSCKEEKNKNNIQETIKKYRLDYKRSTGNTHAKISGTETSINGEGELFSELYANLSTDSCLYIMKNKNNDTLFTYFGKGFANFYYSDIDTIESNYFLRYQNKGETEINHLGGVSWKEPYNPNNLYEDKYFLIDITEKKLIKINKESDQKTIQRVKKKFNLEGGYGIVLFINNIVTISKDTLDKKQAYYTIGFSFRPKKIKGDYVLIPNLKDKIIFQGIFENNIGNNRFHILDLSNKKIYDKYYYQYYLKSDDELYIQMFRPYKHEILVIDKYDHEELIKTFYAEDFFKLDSKKEVAMNGGIVKDFRPDIFKYVNDYFFSPFLPYPDEFMEGYPPIFQIDIIKWKLTKVLPLEKYRQKLSPINNEKDIKMISGNYKGRVSSFNERFGIIKIENEYRLIKKDN